MEDLKLALVKMRDGEQFLGAYIGEDSYYIFLKYPLCVYNMVNPQNHEESFIQMRHFDDYMNTEVFQIPRENITFKTKPDEGIVNEYRYFLRKEGLVINEKEKKVLH